MRSVVRIPSLRANLRLGQGLSVPRIWAREELQRQARRSGGDTKRFPFSFVARYSTINALARSKEEIERESNEESGADAKPLEQHEHAVISAFDLFSIGGMFEFLIVLMMLMMENIAPVGPSSSHTVGPMRAGKIFINDLLELELLDKVRILVFWTI